MQIQFVRQVYFGTWLARINLVSCLFGINCVTGMSCLIRRTALDDAGGLRAFGGYLAEDYFIAEQVQKKVRERGRRKSIDLLSYRSCCLHLGSCGKLH